MNERTPCKQEAMIDQNHHLQINIELVGVNTRDNCCVPVILKEK